MNSDRRKSILSNVEGLSDKFPVGMRVLAVDDSESCLRILEKLLKKCQYHVTTSTDAREALKLVRERKDKFDLVITDVFMPEIDGLRLLQLVGLEMDLPVIMLSGGGDIELVRKGIMNGACDYLLKPVRLEEIKNIWQHVLRRKAKGRQERSRKDDDDDDDDDDGNDNDENLDQNMKEQQEEDKKDEEETEERKKTRVTWTAELNQKFMAAVNQLGPEKAVPKKILELMNQEGLTRENVASHLQKFRQNMKKNPVGMPGQKDILYSTLGGIGPSHLNMCSLGGANDFQALVASRGLRNCGLSSYPSGRMFSSGLHISANLRQNVMLPSEPFQTIQNMSNSINAPNKLLSSAYPSNQLPRLYQGNPTLMELSHLQPNGSITSCGSYDPIPNPATFGIPNNLIDSKPTISSSNVSLSYVPSKPLMTQTGGGFGVQSSSYLDSDQQKNVITGSTSSELLDPSRFNGNWQSTTQLSKFSTNPLQVARVCSNMGGNNYSPIPQFNSSQIASSSKSAISLQMHDSTGSICSQTGFIIDDVPLAGIQAWDAYTQDYTPTLNHDFDPSSYLVPTNDPFSSLNEAMGQNSSTYQMNVASDTFFQQDEVKKLSEESNTRSNESYVPVQMQEQMDFGSSSYGPLADLIRGVPKQEQDGSQKDDGSNV